MTGSEGTPLPDGVLVPTQDGGGQGRELVQRPQDRVVAREVLDTELPVVWGLRRDLPALANPAFVTHMRELLRYRFMSPTERLRVQIESERLARQYPETVMALTLLHQRAVLSRSLAFDLFPALMTNE